MGTFLDEQFTYADNELLQNHGWTEHPGSTGDFVVTSGRIRSSGNFVPVYYPSGILPASPNYEVEAQLRKVSALGGIWFGLGFDTAALNGYIFGWWGAVIQWGIFRLDAGTSVQLGSLYADNPANGTERTGRLVRRGDQISGYVDGVLRCGPVTDSTYTIAGRPVVRGGNGSASTGAHMDWVRGIEAWPGHVREAPPTRLHIDATTPSGRHHRWGDDEPLPADVPRDLRFSTSMPGGFDSLDVTLPRKTKVNYSDLDRLSTLRALGAGGEVAGEYRLERAPRVSGNEVSVSPGAVGWQAALEDDKSASMVYVDIDFSHWQGMSTQRQADLAATYALFDASADSDATTGQPSLKTAAVGSWASPATHAIAEGWYDAGAAGRIGSIYYAWKKGANVDAANAQWSWQVFASTTDTAASLDTSGSLRAAGPGTGTLTTTGGNKRFGLVELLYGIAGGTDGLDHDIFWTCLAVFGNHGLTKQGTGTATAAPGLFASDVIAHAVGRWAPLLNYTTGTDGSISPSGFVIPQLEFREPTTAAEIVKAANRFHLKDWAVWEDKTFYYHDRGARGRRWRARVAPAQLTETGPQVDRLWNGVIVKFNDVDGSSKTVGPVGSGSDTETALLTDSDPTNPANQLGIRRWTGLEMGVSTVAAATQLGQVFVEQSKLLDSSGQAQLVGTVRDDRGIRRPAWQVRAGDYISFVDAADSSYRRIVKTDYSHNSRTCSIDLDAPPEGLDALLERLGVVLVPLGL